MMTVKDLIAQLQTWPQDSEVTVSRYMDGPGMAKVYPVVDVSGVAGSMVDGRDSYVSINIAAKERDVK